MVKSFWNLKPGSIGFQVLNPKGEIETDWIVAELLVKQNEVRIYKFDKRGTIIAKRVTKVTWDKWQNLPN